MTFVGVGIGVGFSSHYLCSLDFIFPTYKKKARGNATYALNSLSYSDESLHI